MEGRHNNFTLEFDGAILTLSAVLDTYPSEQDPNQMLEDKLVIHWDGYVSAQIQTPRNTRTCGMCGDNDGNPDNDMMTRRTGEGLWNILEISERERTATTYLASD